MPSLDVIVMTPSTKGTEAEAENAKLFYQSLLEKWTEIKERFQKATGREIDRVLRSGVECDLDKNLDYYMHGIGRSSPPWVVVLKPADKFYVFVVDEWGANVRVGVVPDQTVRKLKEDLMTKFGVSVETQRLTFNGMQMEEDDLELAHYGVRMDDTIESTLRLGGVGFIPCSKFSVEVSRNDLITKIATGPAPPGHPKWRSVYPGLVLEGKCTKSQCPAALITSLETMDNKSFRIFDAILDSCACAECGATFQPTMCGFHCCEWFFVGVRTVDGESQNVECSWQTVPCEEYHQFEWKRGVGEKWDRLLLTVRPSGAFQKNCSLCNEALGEDNTFLSPCDHIFHAGCWGAYVLVGSQCPSGVSCPVCCKSVP